MRWLYFFLLNFVNFAFCVYFNIVSENRINLKKNKNMLEYVFQNKNFNNKLKIDAVK